MGKPGILKGQVFSIGKNRGFQGPDRSETRDSQLLTAATAVCNTFWMSTALRLPCACEFCLQQPHRETLRMAICSQSKFKVNNNIANMTEGTF